MHDKYPGDVQHPETDGCDNRATQATPEPVMTAERAHQLEKDAHNDLYRLLAEFSMKPSARAADKFFYAMNAYQDAWMLGRRRVMD